LIKLEHKQKKNRRKNGFLDMRGQKRSQKVAMVTEGHKQAAKGQKRNRSQKVAKGHKRLQKVTIGCKSLQKVVEGHKRCEIL
jgi:hypothetical protein